MAPPQSRERKERSDVARLMFQLKLENRLLPFARAKDANVQCSFDRGAGHWQLAGQSRDVCGVTLDQCLGGRAAQHRAQTSASLSAVVARDVEDRHLSRRDAKRDVVFEPIDAAAALGLQGLEPASPFFAQPQRHLPATERIPRRVEVVRSHPRRASAVPAQFLPQ